MSEELKSIHEFDFDLICEYFSALDRQGPGSPEATLKALSFVGGLDAKSRIADVGCGTGGQTVILAKNTPGQITGVDLFPAFIDLFNANAKKFKFQDRMKGVVGSIDKLPFKAGELDLIWAEGAIYNIGFEKGLKEWRRFLKKGGHVAVSEASWFTEKRPRKIEEFWENAYSGIDTIAGKVAVMQKAGYVPLAAFVLLENCWTENFYYPQVKAQKNFLKKYAGNKTVEEFVANEKREAQLYGKYKEFYGYVFYIGKKI